MKLCVPSWQLPGSWLFNLEKLAGIPWIEGIELLFFSYDAEARRLFAAEKAGIEAFAGRFSFSLHLPNSFVPADLDLIESTESFVDLYILHPWDGRKSNLDIGAWVALVEKLRTSLGKDRFAMEYTGEKWFEECRSFAPDLALCADTGCLIRNGRPPLGWIASRKSAIREIHLHAARGEKDHLPLGPGDDWVPGLAAAAAETDWRIVFETFSLEASEASRKVFGLYLPGRHPS